MSNYIILFSDRSKQKARRQMNEPQPISGQGPFTSSSRVAPHSGNQSVSRMPNMSHNPSIPGSKLSAAFKNSSRGQIRFIKNNAHRYLDNQPSSSQSRIQLTNVLAIPHAGFQRVPRAEIPIVPNIQ